MPVYPGALNIQPFRRDGARFLAVAGSVGRSGWVAATVIGVAINDARAVIDALADPETLYVFGVVAARTSKLGLRVSDRAGSTPYVTPFG